MNIVNRTITTEFTMRNVAEFIMIKRRWPGGLERFLREVGPVIRLTKRDQTKTWSPILGQPELKRL